MFFWSQGMRPLEHRVLTLTEGGLNRQLGVLKYLQSHFDLSRVHFRGASAGGLIATLACCGVDLDEAVEKAYNLSMENGVFERPLGVVGIWGGLIRSWLDDLLPNDAHNMCRCLLL